MEAIKLTILFVFISIGVNSQVLFNPQNKSGSEPTPVIGDYYFAAHGNDATGTGTIEFPYKTASKFNSLTLSIGDSALFNAGDEWGETLETKEGVYIGRYGSGVNPKIYGSDIITGWTLSSGSIYVADVSDYVWQVFLNGERQTLARSTNSFDYDITSDVSTTQYGSTDLDGSANYIGATGVFRTSAFTMYSKLITGQSSQTLTMESAFFDRALSVIGYGFFLCDKLSYLDEAGEWFYDDSTSKLYVWTPDSVSPSNYTVRASVRDYGIYAYNSDDAIVENIDVYHAARSGVRVHNSERIVFDGLDIMYPDMFGIHDSIGSSYYTKINDCKIVGANCGGIRTYSRNSKITNNWIEDTGLIENFNKRMNDLKDNNGTGIFAKFNTDTVSYNTIVNSGYDGINFRGLNDVITYNYINGACKTLSDGGGIYTYKGGAYSAESSQGSLIDHNIVVGMYGNPEGSSQTKVSGAYNLYLDNNTSEVTVTNNITKTGDNGIVQNACGENIIEDNIFYDNMLGFASVGIASGYANDFNGNIIFQTDRLGDSKWWTNSYQRMAYVETGSITGSDYNEYYSHYRTEADEVFVRGGAGYYTWAQWKSTYSTDTNGSFDETQFTTETDTLFYNATNAAVVQDVSGGEYKDLNGDPVTSLTLQPFTGQILIYTGILLPSLTVSTPTQGDSWCNITFVGEVISDGDLTVTDRGFVVSLVTDPDLQDTVFAVGSGEGTFEYDWSGAAARETYYVKTYAIRGTTDTTYSTQTFMNTYGYPYVSVPIITDITSTGMTFASSFNDNGNEITQTGIQVGLSLNNGDDYHTGDITSPFGGDVNDLDASTYYYSRAFTLTTCNSKTYSSNRNFTTLAASPTYGGNGGLDTDVDLNSVDVDYPASPTSSDYLVAVVWKILVEETFNTPSGWTKVVSKSDQLLSYAVFVKVGASETGSLNFTCVNGAESFMYGIMYKYEGASSYSGVTAGTPTEVSGETIAGLVAGSTETMAVFHLFNDDLTITNSGTFTVDANSVTSAFDDSRIIAKSATNGTFTSTWSAPSNIGYSTIRILFD